MEENLSKSEKKRRSKRVEHLAFELLDLSRPRIKVLPCSEEIKAEVVRAKDLKGGARKRQVKFIAKTLRADQQTASALLDFLEEFGDSKLKETKSFHELEHYRDILVSEAITAYKAKTMHSQLRIGEDDGNSGDELIAVNEVIQRFPGLDAVELQRLARQYARSRKNIYSREIFRMMKSALERERFNRKEEPTSQEDE